MGLDMYLTGNKYLSPQTPEEAKLSNEIAKALGLKPKEGDDHVISTITIDLAYWRKANQIHKWFVDNCQGGIDECQKAYVSTESMQELIDLCKVVIKNPEKGKELLPTEQGFFFGTDEYDKYYVEDLKYTITALKAALVTQKELGLDVYYRSSW